VCLISQTPKRAFRVSFTGWKPVPPDGNNNLLRKYIYGPGIDQPVCMIEVADANAVYYYHFDAPFDYAQGRL